ncbi:MAG: DNA-directed RNA polymerase subunit alpha [Candidatus Sulfobium sp.]
MNLRKKGFQLPDKFRFDEETLSSTYGKLVVEPLERGFGTTIGNALRRVLLSSLEGAAITAVKISGALHEFSTINGIKEDVINIILNMKALRLKSHAEGTKVGTFNVKGPAQVTGADLKCDSSIEILNPEYEIATLDKGVSFDAEVYIRKGKGYVSLALLNLFISEEEEDESVSAEEPAVAHSEQLYSSTNDNLFKNVDELELSVRSYNCLKNANIRTIAELVQKSETEMLKTKNFGRKSLNEIKEILGKMGLHLGMKVDLEGAENQAVHTGGVEQDAS